MENPIFAIFPKHLRDAFEIGGITLTDVEEIRVRILKPLIFRKKQGEFYFHLRECSLESGVQDAYIITRMDIQTMITFVSRYSLYAYTEELKNGFITLTGGHRVGLAGQAVMDGEKVISMSYVSFLNIRVAHQTIGCAKNICPYLKEGHHVFNTLIVSSAGVGKTTCLRDCVRILSGEEEADEHYRIGVVDERSEIAACHMGIPQNNLGICTDVLDRCRKSQGMLMLLRSMAPDIIAVDELGSEADFLAVEQVLNSGCTIIGTVHAADMEELKGKKNLMPFLMTQMFERYVIIRRRQDGGRYYEIYNGVFERIL